MPGVVAESTYNWYWLVDADFSVTLANTIAMKRYNGLKHSGDEDDAAHLAHLLRLRILPTGYIHPPAQRAIRDLARKRIQLVRLRTQQVQVNAGENQYHARFDSRRKQSNSTERNVWRTGVDLTTFLRERPGISTFVLGGGTVYHAHSSYARGLDSLLGMWQWLDRAPKGRNETGHWWRRHDEYDELTKKQLRKENT